MNKNFDAAQKIINRLLEAPQRTYDPDVETEDPQVDPDVAPAEPVIPPEKEPDKKPNPFRRREIKPGHEPSPKARESKAEEVVNRLIG